MDRRTPHRRGINPHVPICRFNAILLKVPARFLFVDIDNLTLKFMWKGAGPRIAKTLKREKKVGKITLPDVKACYIAAVTRIVGHLWRDRNIDGWDGIEGPEIHPYKQAQWAWTMAHEQFKGGQPRIFNRWDGCP